MFALGVGLVLAAAILVAVTVMFRQSISGGALGAYIVPYAEVDDTSRHFIGGGVWAYGVRASWPLVRLEVTRDHLRLGPSSAAWAVLIPSLRIPRSDVHTIAEVKRPFGVRAVRFELAEGAVVFIGHVEEVLGAIAAHPPDSRLG